MFCQPAKLNCEPAIEAAGLSDNNRFREIERPSTPFSIRTWCSELFTMMLFLAVISQFSSLSSLRKMDADPAVKTGVVFDFVPDKIRHDAGALRWL